jgi:hypothetical protein
MGGLVAAALASVLAAPRLNNVVAYEERRKKQHKERMVDGRRASVAAASGKTVAELVDEPAIDIHRIEYLADARELGMKSFDFRTVAMNQRWCSGIRDMEETLQAKHSAKL